MLTLVPIYPVSGSALTAIRGFGAAACCRSSALVVANVGSRCRAQQKRKAERMDHDTYMAKLVDIRAALYGAHLEAVSDYPRPSPKETLDRIIAPYEPGLPPEK